MIDRAIVKFVIGYFGPDAASELKDGGLLFEGADGKDVPESRICPGQFPDCCFISEWGIFYALKWAILAKVSAWRW